jgi:hypothetical protein
MKKKPICIISNCNNPALILYCGEWICGECLVKFDKLMNEDNLKKLKEVLEK